MWVQWCFECFVLNKIFIKANVIYFFLLFKNTFIYLFGCARSYLTIFVVAYGIFLVPWPGLNPGTLHGECGATGPPEKSLFLLFHMAIRKCKVLYIACIIFLLDKSGLEPWRGRQKRRQGAWKLVSTLYGMVIKWKERKQVKHPSTRDQPSKCSCQSPRDTLLWI